MMWTIKNIFFCFNSDHVVNCIMIRLVCSSVLFGVLLRVCQNEGVVGFLFESYPTYYSIENFELFKLYRLIVQILICLITYSSILLQTCVFPKFVAFVWSDIRLVLLRISSIHLIFESIACFIFCCEHLSSLFLFPFYASLTGKSVVSNLDFT